LPEARLPLFGKPETALLFEAANQLNQVRRLGPALCENVQMIGHKAVGNGVELFDNRSFQQLLPSATTPQG
jgi:hypothetical protein